LVNILIRKSLKRIPLERAKNKGKKGLRRNRKITGYTGRSKEPGKAILPQRRDKKGLRPGGKEDQGRGGNSVRHPGLGLLDPPLPYPFI
jgi:hypothetical protein